MGNSSDDFPWISDYFNHKEISFADSGTWRLIHKISEKTCQLDYPPPFESITVFICKKACGDGVGQKAVMKIRTEYHDLHFSSRF
jgi:hypothetical protein